MDKQGLHNKSKHQNKAGISLLLFLLPFVFVSALTIGWHNFRMPQQKITTSPEAPQPKPKQIEIIHSDVLYKRKTDPGADILVGNVRLRHEDAFLDCDSARYYREKNLFYAFGNVQLTQGDTLKLTCDKITYDGNVQVANARDNVKLYHKKERLETEKLDYDRLSGDAKYSEGGTIYQEDKVLYSYYGIYNTFSHTAKFQQDAKLKDSQNTITCDIGNYNTDTKVAVLEDNIKLIDNKGNVMTSDNGRYETEDHFMKAWNNVQMVDRKKNVLNCDIADYNTETEELHCYDNVRLKASDGNVMTCDEGDYNGKTALAHFSSNVVLTRPEGGTMTCERGTYNSDTHIADFYDNVSLVKTDSKTGEKHELNSSHLIYNTQTEVAYIDTDTNIHGANGEFIYSTKGEYNTKTGKAVLLDRSYIIKDGRRIDGDIIKTYKQDDTGFNVSEAVGNVIISDPVNQFGLEGDSCIRVEDTGYDWAYGNVIITDSINKCHVLGHHCEYDEKNGYALATDSAEAIYYYYQDTVYVHSDSMKIFTFNIETDSVYRNLHAYHKVRMFRNDIQGVCDSLVHLQRDSCTYLYGQPIIWNLQQQVFGEEIRAYNNDSTIDWVHVINQAMTIEQLDSVSYNQVQAKEMFAYFKDGQIEHNEARGNVYVVYFIEEDEGKERIGMNYTETTELKMYMEEKKLKKIWMSAGKGTVYNPLEIPGDKRYLPAFAWFDDIRPKNKDDIFVWKEKDQKYILKKTVEKKVPIQKLDNIK